MTMREKQILARAIEIQKENWGNRAFLETIILKAVKYKEMYGIFFQIEALFILSFHPQQVALRCNCSTTLFQPRWMHSHHPRER